MSAAKIKGAVIVRFDERGEIDYTVVGDAVRLFIVDERTPGDRVYEWLPRATAKQFRAIIPAGEEIGNSVDERHDAIAARINAAIEGRPHLSIVEEPRP